MSSATSMADMFYGATALEQNLGSWHIVLDDASIDHAEAPGVVAVERGAQEGRRARYGVEISGQDIVTSTWVWSPEMGSLVARVEGVRTALPTELDMPQVGPNPFSGIDLDSVIQVITAL